MKCAPVYGGFPKIYYPDHYDDSKGFTNVFCQSPILDDSPKFFPPMPIFSTSPKFYALNIFHYTVLSQNFSAIHIILVTDFNTILTCGRVLQYIFHSQHSRTLHISRDAPSPHTPYNCYPRPALVSERADTQDN